MGGQFGTKLYGSSLNHFFTNLKYIYNILYIWKNLYYCLKITYIKKSNNFLQIIDGFYQIISDEKISKFWKFFDDLLKLCNR